MPVTIHRSKPLPIDPEDPTYRKILGLDISTKTGMAVVSASQTGVQVIELKKVATEAKHFTGQCRFNRWAVYIAALETFIDAHHPDVAYIEGYGFSQKNSAIPLIEIGALLRATLRRAGIPWIEVPPTTLKKFVTGSGKGDKNVMLKEAYKRLALDLSDDDLCDAACLGYFGAVALNHPVALPAAHLAVASGYGLQSIAKSA